MVEESYKNSKLKGRSKYLEWNSRFKAMAKIKKWKNTAGNFISTKSDDILEWLINNISDSAIGCVDPDLDIEDVLEAISKEHGFGYMNPDAFLESIREFIAFPVLKNPQTIFAWLEKQLSTLESLTGDAPDRLCKQLLLKGLASGIKDDVFKTYDFWFQCRGALNMMDAEKNFEDYKDYVYKFWDAHRNTSVTVNEDLFDPSTRKAPTPRANQVHGGERAKERRACTWCAKYKERRCLAKGHNTDRCFFGDNPCKVRLDAQAGANNAQVEQEDNIPDSNYFSAFYDTGATPNSFFKDKPRNFQPETGVVRTAGADQGGVVTKGKGTASFGQLRLRGVVHVPSFKHNLVSGTQIMKMGLKQIIEHDKLTILDKGKIVASGHYDAATGLIKMDHDAPCAKTGSNSRRPYVGAATSDIDWHSRVGHIGEAIVTATLKRHGLEMGAKALTKCEPCCLGKAVRNNVPKVGSQPSNYNEIIESDTQGPFPIPAHDGTRSNVKFVEAKSGWVHMAPVLNLKAETMLKEFQIFQARIENWADRKVKIVRTDGGTEYLGVFKNYLIEAGIMKQTALPYEHHIPGKAERSHRTVMSIWRVMMTESRLPQRYYVEAQLCAIYLYNRVIHSGNSMSPYEQIFGKKPRLDHLRRFGCVCYALIPKELRNKLQNSSEKCRLLGYGDDFAAEEVKGYNLLRESDKSIFYSNSVVFDENAVMEPLEKEEIDAYGTTLNDVFGEEEPQWTQRNESDENLFLICCLQLRTPVPILILILTKTS